MNSSLQQTDLDFKRRKSSGGEEAVPFTLALDRCFISLIFRLSSFMRLNFVLFSDSSQVMYTTHLSSESQPKRLYTDIVFYVTFLRDTIMTTIFCSMYSKRRLFFQSYKKKKKKTQHYGLFYFCLRSLIKGDYRSPSLSCISRSLQHKPLKKLDFLNKKKFESDWPQAFFHGHPAIHRCQDEGSNT